MSALTVIAPLSALAFGAYKLAKGSVKAVDNLAYEPRGSKIKFKTLHPRLRIPIGAIVTVKLAIINNQGTPLFFDSIAAKGLYNTSPIGTATYATRTIIPARGEAVIDLPVTIGLGPVVKALFALWTDTKADNMGQVAMAGTVKAGPLSFDFDEKWPLKKQPKTT